MSRWPGISVLGDEGTGLPALLFEDGETMIRVPLDGRDVIRAADALARWEREHAAEAVLDEDGKGAVTVGGTAFRVRRFSTRTLSWHARPDGEPEGLWGEDALGDSLEEALALLLTRRHGPSRPHEGVHPLMVRAFDLAGPAPRRGGEWKDHVLRAVIPVALAGEELSERGWAAVLSGLYDLAFDAGKRAGSAPVTVCAGSGNGAEVLRRIVGEMGADQLGALTRQVLEAGRAPEEPGPAPAP